jgi:phosphatidylserine decarboxylase
MKGLPKNIPMKIHREGTNILILLFIVLAVLNVPVWLFMPPVIIPALLSLISVVVYLFVFNFFRSPRRHYRGERENMVVSSVDGKVVAVERVYEREFLKSEAIMFSVFMTPFNVHANWFPVDGTVEYVKHHNGRFLGAYLPKSSTENERSTVGIRLANGRRITVRQIAGAMARRIVTYARRGESANIDNHLGFIKFGSRVDIYLPVDAEILLSVGDFTVGGITPIAVVKPTE